jgi:hypothetical protein
MGTPLRLPATQTGETLPGVGPAASEGASSRAQAAGGDTQPSIAPASPRPPVGGRAFARLPDYASHSPLFGPESRVVYTIEDGDAAAALYNRLYRGGQTNILSTEHPDATRLVWEQDGGVGEPPAAWVRNGDGVVRFNRAKFAMPDFTDLHPQSTVAPKPVPAVPPPLMYDHLVRPEPGARPASRAFARLPEYSNHTPLFGPESRVVYTIEDGDAAAALYSRLQREGQTNILSTEHPDATQLVWEQDGGVGEPPAAWVRSGDGVVRFDRAKLPAQRGPESSK